MPTHLPPALQDAYHALNVEAIRQDFPALHQKVNNKPLIYFDNGASSQKPRPVLDAIMHSYSMDYANVHRGLHTLSERATRAFEEARLRVQRFLHAASEREIIFVRGATEGINLVAHSFLRPRIQKGDQIVISAMEHHANIVPWQILANEIGFEIKVVPIDSDGTLDLDAYQALLSPKVRLVSIVHVSNALGTVNPVESIVELAHRHSIPVLLDGAQAVTSRPIDVQALGCDFYVFSGHKLFGPTGIGVLYGREELLQAMTPYQGGGDMIASVSFEKTTFNDLPYKFEAGTPHIVGAIGLAKAIEYVEALGLEKIQAYTHQLLLYATDALRSVPGLRMIGTSPKKSAILAFVLQGVHPHDLGTLLDQQGIAIRAGHHCAQPVLSCFQVSATARASLTFYNTPQEVDAFVAALHKILALFA